MALFLQQVLRLNSFYGVDEGRSEFLPESFGLRGFQLWHNLPAKGAYLGQPAFGPYSRDSLQTFHDSAFPFVIFMASAK